MRIENEKLKQYKSKSSLLKRQKQVLKNKIEELE